MATWKLNVGLILVFVTILNVGKGGIIKTTTERSKTTTPPSSTTDIPVPADKLTVSATVNTTSMNATTNENATTHLNETTRNNLTVSLNVTDGSLNTTISDISGSKILDLAFVMDTTGSMGSYIDSARNNIRNLVDEIAVNSNIDLRVALVEYRDHPPQEKSFITRKYDFTKSVEDMKTWLNNAKAQGGGDAPEAVAEGLFDVTILSWRPNAAKITVLISDAPPHGLAPWDDRTFKEGSPLGNDPIKIAQDLAKREVIVYAVGCEPSIDPYKDFFMALAYITGGQYIPLSDPLSLIQAIIGGAREEISLQKFSSVVEEEINKITASGAVVDEANIAKVVYDKLQQQGATAQQLLRNNKTLEGASKLAKTFAASRTMADVRMAYESEYSSPRRAHLTGMSASSGMSRGSSKRFEMMEAEGFPPVPGAYEFKSAPSAPSLSLYADSVPLSSSPRRPASMASSSSSFSSTSDARTSDAGESYSTVDSAVSYEQVARLVRKKTAKLSPTPL